MSKGRESRLEALQDLEPSVEEFRTEVVQGLSNSQKTLPCKFLYDRRGSEIFDRICDLPEYYPTRTELNILQRHAGDIAASLGPEVRLVEFGSGAGTKIRLLLTALDRPAAYLPVDISREHLIAANADLARSFHDLSIAPVCADYTEPFALPELAGIRYRTTAGFFPGSTIGNFTRAEAVGFLSSARRLLGAGAVMIVGVDLVKDIDVLQAAYDDEAGVTAEFNLNLLRRINRELAGTFDLSHFRHEARWNAELERIEMHLVSLRDQEVTVGTRRFRFRDGETIHTENSHKYRLDGFRELARQAGYEPIEVWTDEKKFFSVHALRARQEIQAS
ncbi:MAG: L-histidine N(alpha)-methyltransferase [Parvibaculum sp.]|uniref:L-histidine N(alpha)-methyltransferase n=1 Tax=Parvibaculum sp. TaxID=2024848 RepID=UPI002AB97F21|nr:L-histidine N(alpha)-methyltransferase [Parvibaculum sp.]MDZ4380147.1 L-histidine N(alpha)-methyltransferase [Parvibaculum sp.]